ncbi:MAG: CocE/NonD family hydrolase [Nannocystaceae bacterium]
MRPSLIVMLSLAVLAGACARAQPPPPVVPEPVAAATPEPAAEPAVTSSSHPAIVERVELRSGGWVLIGDFVAPAADHATPAALLLHRAAGSRGEYEQLARALAERGVASLRLDLRACGESTNLGQFVEPYAEHRHLLEGTPDDVRAALDWLKGNAVVDGERVAVVGASYSGEMVGEALRAGGPAAAAYVMVSPGSFSDESIALIDRSGAPWLFVRTTEESPVSRPFIDEVFDALARGSKLAEVRVLEGEGHATRIFDLHPTLIDELAGWIAGRLAS